jgi:hypothetical protein
LFWTGSPLQVYLANTNVTKRPTKMLPLMNKLEFGGR